MTQSFRFKVGHITVSILSDQPDCSRDIQAITSLYPSSSAEPELSFSIRCCSTRIKLTLNGQYLWAGHDAGEVVAGFEVFLYTHIVKKLAPKLESLHAASVAINDKACLFAGISDAGKSSLCTKAILEGCHYFSDEFSLLSESGRIEAFPRPLQWGKEEHPAFSKELMISSKLLNHATFSFPDKQGNILNTLLWLPTKIQHKALPLQWVILPCYNAQAEASKLTPIRRGEALMELPQHLHHRQRPDLMLQMLNRRIPKQTQFYRLNFSDVHQAWHHLIHQISA
ncbi:MAG: hypothetical protein R8K49_01970 [Mariprofundaceae bacterium]